MSIVPYIFYERIYFEGAMAMSRVKIYTKSNCPWCDKLKSWLDEENIAYQEIDIEENREAVEFLQEQELYTVPQVFIDGVHRDHEPSYYMLLEWLKKDPAKAVTSQQVTKRNGEDVPFNAEKIAIAIGKANHETEEMKEAEVQQVTEAVVKAIGKNPIHVEEIQDLVEEQLMLQGFTKTAKAYILYRDKQTQMRKRDIFKPRDNYRPFEYPELFDYGEAVQHSYWLHTEYNYDSSVHDFKVNVTDAERNAIKNCMLAISQVEVTVKNYWGALACAGFGNSVPIVKPEISGTAAIFCESEVRHSEAYSNLLTLLGLLDEFEHYKEIPALHNRVEYLKSYNRFVFTGNKRDYTLSMILFSAFIEHISLFSQFLIMMAFNRHRNLFSGLSNAIEATSKEEQLHGEFGVEIVNIIRAEHPEWFDEDLANTVYALSKECWSAEQELLDWIFEDGELDFLPKHDVKEFVKHRVNNSLEAIGLERIFEEDEEAVERTLWFDEEILTTKHTDFFAKRSVNYTKRAQSVTADDLF